MIDPIPYVEAEVKRFKALVDELPNGCHFWTGARSRGKGNRKWYGTFWVNAKIGRVRAHRYACEVLGNKGVLPPGYDRDHECVFSLCVNEAHVAYITKKQNQEKKHERRKNLQQSVDRDGCLGSSDLAPIRGMSVRSSPASSFETGGQVSLGCDS